LRKGKAQNDGERKSVREAKWTEKAGESLNRPIGGLGSRELMDEVHRFLMNWL
jgi:hypothetical protein